MEVLASRILTFGRSLIYSYSVPRFFVFVLLRLENFFFVKCVCDFRKRLVSCNIWILNSPLEGERFCEPPKNFALKKSFHVRPTSCDIYVRRSAVGKAENPGVPVLFGGHNLSPLVRIGLTDLPKSGGAMAPPAPPGTTPLVRTRHCT